MTCQPSDEFQIERVLHNMLYEARGRFVTRLLSMGNVSKEHATALVISISQQAIDSVARRPKHATIHAMLLCVARRMTQLMDDHIAHIRQSEVNKYVEEALCMEEFIEHERPPLPAQNSHFTDGRDAR